MRVTLRTGALFFCVAMAGCASHTELEKAHYEIQTMAERLAEVNGRVARLEAAKDSESVVGGVNACCNAPFAPKR